MIKYARITTVEGDSYRVTFTGETLESNKPFPKIGAYRPVLGDVVAFTVDENGKYFCLGGVADYNTSGGGDGSLSWENIANKPSVFPSTPSLAGLGNVQNYGIATVDEALVGQSNSAYMTPSRVESKMRKEIDYVRLPVQADMNNYTKEGKYYCDLNVDVSTMKNVPFPDTAFSMIVLKNAGCTQIATTFQNAKEAIKIRNEYQGLWGAWVDVLTAKHVTWDLANGGYLIPDCNAVQSYTTSNFIRDMKRNLSVADLNNPNYPFPYITSTDFGVDLGLSNTWYHIQYYKHQDNNGYGCQIALPLEYARAQPTILVRNSNGMTWSSWRDVATGGLKKVHKISGLVTTSNGQRTIIAIPNINSANSFVGNTTGCVYTNGSLAVTILNNTQVELIGIFNDGYGRDVNYSFEIIEFY